MAASDEAIAIAVKTLINAQLSDPANAGASVTLTSIVRHVEAVLAVDLLHKREFIKEQVDLLLGPSQTVQTPQFLFQPYNPIFFQPPPFNQVGDGAGPPQAAQFINPVVFHPQPLNQARDEIQFEGVSSSGGARTEEVEFVAVVPPQQYGHGAVAAGARPIGSKLNVSESATPKRKGKAGGLNMLCKVTPELQAIVGEPIMARTQIVKKLWAYIRENKLQDQYNKRIINCNDKLRLVFETDVTDMFQMNKLLAKHIVTINDSEDMGPDPKKMKGGITTVLGVTEQAQISSTTTEQAQRYSTTTEQPWISFTTSEQPQIFSTTSEQPQIFSTTSEQHQIYSNTTDQPQTYSNTTEQPQTYSTTTEQPKISSITAEQPRVPSTTAEQPQISTTTKQPQISSTTAEQPQISSTTTEQPRIFSTTAEQPHVVSTATEQPVVLSDALVEFFGTEDKEMFQSEALNRVLDYVKENQLEDPADPTTIHCDFRLHQLFGCENFSILEVPEMLAYHLVSKS